MEDAVKVVKRREENQRKENHVEEERSHVEEEAGVEGGKFFR